MLAISPTSQPKKITPNILPCSIKRSGPIPTSKRYWSPTLQDDKTSTAYFRGRKLRGRNLKLPSDYTGIVLQNTDKPLPQKRPTAEELRRVEEDDIDVDLGLGSFDSERPVEVKMMEQMGSFDEVVVWGHEVVPDGEDVYVKGVEEWIGFAEAMHSYDMPEQTQDKASA